LKRSTNRILTTHVGSLVRPPEIAEIMRGLEAGQPFNDQQKGVLKSQVADVVKMQVDCGIDIVSDGELGKAGFSQYADDRLSGFEWRDDLPRRGGGTVRSRDRRAFAAAYAEIESGPAGTAGTTGGGAGGRRRTGWSVCTGPISFRGKEAVATDLANFKAALAGQRYEEAFVPAVGPGTVELQRNNVYYKTEEEYLFAIADALKEEYRMIVDAGFILQIDDPRIVTEWDSMDPPPTAKEYRDFAQVRIDALNHALAGLPEDRVRYHMCWGSWHGPHTTDAPLEEIAEVILQVNAGAFSLEAANPRHEHEYHVWERIKFPDGKVIIPGVISHITNHVEHPELVAERLIRYANIVGRENVIGGVDCGYAQGAFTQRVHPSIGWEKFRMLAAGAKLASERLWK
jgi:5-methyltetrahydropteroyltriglutamate--homocysteine methyltransferase